MVLTLTGLHRGVLTVHRMYSSRPTDKLIARTFFCVSKIQRLKIPAPRRKSPTQDFNMSLAEKLDKIRSPKLEGQQQV
jgi:hypothetical protein